MSKSKIQNIENILGYNRVKENYKITSFLTMKIRGVASYFYEAKSREDLINCRKASLELEIPLVIIGGGSNIVPKKEKLNGLVVVDRYMSLKKLSEDDDKIILSVSSGYPVTKLVNEAIEAGWEGFEYFFGLPGTVGGAIYINAKWERPEHYFSDNLTYAFLIDDRGSVKKVSRDYFQFAYDYSILQKTKEILLEAIFVLEKEKREILKKRALEVAEYRKTTQPIGVHSSGCFFKNISDRDRIKLRLPTVSAGYLIDKAGLKGLNVGNFYVSDKHANFIINKSQGRPADLLKLVAIIKKKVKDKFGVELEEEVILV